MGLIDLVMLSIALPCNENDYDINLITDFIYADIHVVTFTDSLIISIYICITFLYDFIYV